MIRSEFSYLQKVVQNEGNIVSSMDGETVMLNIDKGKYYNLGAIGGEIWGMIKNPVSVDEIVDRLCVVYLVERGECGDHVSAFLEQLYAEGLIQTVEQ